MIEHLLPWHVWVVLGIIFVIIEIFDPMFFFIALGIAAIVTGMLSLIIPIGNSIPVQIVIFAVLSFITFLYTRKIGKKFLRKAVSETNVFALKGKTGYITKAIPLEGKGRVRVESEEWVAVSEDKQPVELDAKVTVLSIDGNKLVVKKEQ